VVIAIIGILASLLLPALQQAKGKALAGTCMGNLKQVGAAGAMYETDHDDYMPTPYYNGSWDYPACFANSLPGYLGMTALGSAASWRTGLGPDSVLTCPTQYAVRGQVRTYAGNASLILINFTNSGLASDQIPIRKDWLLRQTSSAGRIPIRSDTIPYFVDGFWYFNDATPGFPHWRNLDQNNGFDPTTWNGHPHSQPHSRGSMITFLDGHAERKGVNDDVWTASKRPSIGGTGRNAW
jgi:prepilin-type processing-associated H-X9-DG protein